MPKYALPTNRAMSMSSLSESGSMSVSYRDGGMNYEQSSVRTVPCMSAMVIGIKAGPSRPENRERAAEPLDFPSHNDFHAPHTPS
jgi:hypothetical protein